MIREFTATVYILEKGKLLLVWHAKYQKWMPAGGHVEPNEAPHEAALREALEETGLSLRLLSQDQLVVATKEAATIPRPYLCLIEEIPATSKRAAHQHIDFVYLGEPLKATGGETKGRWFDLEQVLQLEEGREVFSDAKQLMCHLLQREATP